MRLPLISKLFSKKSPDHYLAIDLGTHEVKAAIFKTPTEFEHTHWLGMGRQLQGLSSMQAGRIQDLDAVIETVNLAIEEAQLKAGVSPDAAILGLSGGVIYAKGLRVRTHRAHPDQTLAADEFDVLAEQIEERTLEQAQSELEEKYRLKLTRVETTFTAFQMDAAKVKTPLGLTGGDLEVGVLHYFIESESQKTINSLAQQLGLEIISLVDASVNLAASEIEQHFDHILVDIGGRVTEVVVVKSGKVVASEILLMGGHDLTDQIVHDLNITYDEAETLKLDFVQGHLDHERGRLVKRSIEAALDWWVEGVATALAELKITELPATLLVSGGSRNLSELKTALVSYPWNKSLNFVGFPKVEVLENKFPELEALTKLEV